MNKLNNLISNSKFEELEYNVTNNRPNTITIKDWFVSNENKINDLYTYNGSYSIFLTSDELYTTLKNRYYLKHKYYYRIYYRVLSDSVNTFITEISLGKKSTNDKFYEKSYSMTNTDILKWYTISDIIDLNNVTGNYYQTVNLYCRNTLTANDDMVIDSIMLIDLTAAFGDGFEPSKEWCDENIPYFENEYDMNLLPKEIEFTCKDQFIYDENTKKYYSNTYTPKITFSVKNVDKNYNVINNNDIEYLSKRIRLDYTGYDKNNETLYPTQSKYIDMLYMNYYDNTCDITFDLFSFSKLNHHVKLEIYSDLSNGTRVKDELIIYFVGNYNHLEYNLDYNLSYSSTYLRRLKGTTNAYDDVPTNVDVFINGVKTSPVDILNQDDKLTVFEKDLYLSDGTNDIEVVTTDICGNRKSKNTQIYVDCMTPTPDKKDLLKNFIADDDLKISLHLGNADLKYETKNAGMEKEVLIDTSIDSHYFKLSGENANLYRISKDKIPKIQGDIIRRPLGITFDYVEKIYDGNNDITSAIKKLKLDDGYYLRDVHQEYNDYAGTGLVRGTFERKVTSDTLAKANENIKTEYLLDKPNIDFSNVYINIDGIEGYALDEPNSNSSNIILQDNSLNNIFKSIDLIRNEQDNTSVLMFTYQDDVEIEYKVINGLNIKYNYSDKSGSNYVTYKTSDEGLMQVDFEDAFFKTKDVTDEIQSITLNNIKFTGDVLGDASNNYQIANYSSIGKILRRTINAHIRCLDKIYDGSPVVPITIDEKYYNGFENVISGDDVYLDTTYEGDKDSETHIFAKNGTTIFTTDDSDVGDNKDAKLNSIFLEGHDAKNYKLGEIISNYKTNIKVRPINVVVNKIRFIRATRQWELEYTILNDIKTDKLTIVYNSNDTLDIKVFGGVDSNGISIHDNYVGHPDIINLFFNYPFNLDYQFSNIDTEVKKISDDKTTAYWRNEARPAEPDTERIDIIPEVNNEYPGEIKFTLDTSFSGVQTPYFESENKDYRLYSGCKVMVTNLNLNPLNNKSKNYTLLNSTCETEIEII